MDEPIIIKLKKRSPEGMAEYFALELASKQNEINDLKVSLSHAEGLVREAKEWIKEHGHELDCNTFLDDEGDMAHLSDGGECSCKAQALLKRLNTEAK